MRYWIGACLITCVVGAGEGQAQSAGVAGQVQRLPGPPPRDRALPSVPGTGVIEGTVIDEATGLGIPRAVVQMGGGGGRPETARADEEGKFVFTELRPGRYHLSATKSGYTGAGAGPPRSLLRASRDGGSVSLAPGERRKGVQVRLGRAGVIAGRVLDAYGDPVEFAQISATRIHRGNRQGPESFRGVSTNDLGEFRVAGLLPGEYLVCATPRMMRISEEQVRPVDTCYPGTAIKADAVPVALQRSQTVTGIDIALVEREAVPVTGRVVDSQGQPMASAMLSLVEKTRGGSSRSSGFGSALKPDGTFRLLLVPGRYFLEARGNYRTGNPVQGPPEAIGVVPIVVDSEPITGIEVRMGSASRVSGRIVFEGDSPRPSTPTQVGITFTNDDPEATCHAQGPAVVAEDWSYSAASVWGTCTVQGWAGGPWILKSVSRDGNALSDRQITLAGETVRDLRLIFTDRRASLSFQVTDDRGTPTREFVAFVFPTARERWGRPGTMTLTFVPRDAAAADGAAPGIAPSTGRASAMRGDLSTVIPGDYYVAAVDDATWEDTRDPEFLATLAESAVRVTLGEGEHRVVSLRRLAASADR